MKNSLSVIGRAELIDFLDADIKDLPAKVDTGAYRSSVWATRIKEHDGELSFQLLGPKSEFYTGKKLTTTEFKVVQVENSFGAKQKRYSVWLSIRVGGKKVRSNFTLANRASKTYPVLLGRKLLKNRFVVDVAKGNPLPDEEVVGDESLA